ncbi:substrate-binding periplasmic protein [Pseudodesulfovibrio profundus]|nr:ABC transporter substrate-binding protein [Pseudodesulfovibrio profundus]
MLLHACVIMLLSSHSALAEKRLVVMTELAGSSAFLQDGKLDGQAVEIAREIMRRTGDTAEVVVMPWARGYETLQTRPNTVLLSTSRTAERENQFHWVGPILKLQWVMVGLKGANIQISCLDDAKKLNAIGTYINDARDQFLVRKGFTNLDRATNGLLNYKKLLHGRVDAIISSDLAVLSASRQLGVHPELFKVLFSIKDMDVYIAISDGTSMQKVKAWQDAFQSMQADGAYQAIQQKWYPFLSEQ